MSRKGKLADINPFGAGAGGGDTPTEDSPLERPRLSMSDADTALFGELSRREGQRQVVRTISIFSIYPDVKQPRRAVPSTVRAHWSGEPKDIADLFNVWLRLIAEERKSLKLRPFNLDELLWAEAVEAKGRTEDEALPDDNVGPVERSFRRVLELAVSIRRDGLANPVTVQRIAGQNYRLETGERRWLAFQVLYGYFDGADGKPQERDKWGSIPALVVDDFSVWRQASENAARADLNAIGRARQFAILLMDLLEESGIRFQSFESVTQPGKSDRGYYAQVVNYRVPTGKAEMLSNGLGVAHRAAFSRCRTLLGLPDEVWTIGDNLDISEDELLKIARIENPDEAVALAKEIVATRNNNRSDESALDATKKTAKSAKPPTLLADEALQRGKRLFSKQNALLAKQIFDLKDGVGEASPDTKRQLRETIKALRACLNQLEALIGGRD